MAGWSAWPLQIAARGAAGSAPARRPARSSSLALRVQIFGRRDSRDTQKALRFFKERRVEASFVDVARRPPAAGELRRFSQRFGAAALLDTTARPYIDGGLAYLRMSDDEVFERLLAEPRLLRLPLVRAGTRLTVGADEAAWRSWLLSDD